MAAVTAPEVEEVGPIMVGRSEGHGPVKGIEVRIAGLTYVRFGTKFFEPCGRCSPSWTGSVSGMGHVLAGVCFECGGAGVGKSYDSAADVVKVAERRARARQRAAEKRAAKEAERLAALATFRAEHEALLTRAEPFTEPAEWQDGWEPSDPTTVTHLATKARSVPLTEAEVTELDEALPAAEANAAAKAAKIAARRFVGKPGEKLAVVGTVIACVPIEQRYGYGRSTSYVFVVEGEGPDVGVTVKWWSSRWPGAHRGDKVDIIGTVKDHEVYEGVPQTSVTRARVTVIEDRSDDA